MAEPGERATLQTYVPLDRVDRHLFELFATNFTVSLSLPLSADRLVKEGLV